MKAFAADYKKFEAAGAQVLGVSHDDPKTQARFKLHCAAPFPLLSDRGGKVAQAYGVDNPLHLFRRATFLIDEQGILREIVLGMPDNEAILAKLSSWGHSSSLPSAAPEKVPQGDRPDDRNR